MPSPKTKLQECVVEKVIGLQSIPFSGCDVKTVEVEQAGVRSMPCDETYNSFLSTGRGTDTTALSSSACGEVSLYRRTGRSELATREL